MDTLSNFHYFLINLFSIYSSGLDVFSPSLVSFICDGASFLLIGHYHKNEEQDKQGLANQEGYNFYQAVVLPVAWFPILLGRIHGKELALARLDENQGQSRGDG